MNQRVVLLFAFLFSIQLGYAQTELSGEITEDLVLTKEGSPYDLVGTFIIPVGVNVYIEPGVTVRSVGGRRVFVEGGLIIQGVEKDSVFIDNIDLEFMNGVLDSSSINYLSIKNRTRILLVEDNNPRTKGSGTLTIRHSKLGILQDNTYSNSEVVVEYCKFSGFSFFTSLSPSGSRLVARNSEFIGTRIGTSSTKNGLIENCVLRKFTTNFAAYIPNINDTGHFDFDSCEFNGGVYWLGKGGEIRNSWGKNAGFQIHEGAVKNCSFLGSVFRLYRSNMSNCYVSSVDMNYEIVNAYPSGVYVHQGPSYIDSTTIIGYHSAVTNSKRPPSFTSSIDSLVVRNSYLKGYSHFGVQNRSKYDVYVQDTYWGVSEEDSLQEVIYDISDNRFLNLGTVYVEGILNEFPFNIPPSIPQNLFIGFREGKETLVWDENSESMVMGYNIYEKDGNEYRLLGTVDSSHFFRHASLSLDKQYVVTAITKEADGNIDLYEGFESEFSVPSILPYTGSIETSRAAHSKCHEVTTSVSIDIPELDFEETYRVELSRQEDDFRIPGVLGYLSPDSTSKTFALPDTLAPGAEYRIRVVAITSDLYVETADFLQIDLRAAKLIVDDPEAVLGGTSTITFVGQPIPDGEYFWHFSEYLEVSEGEVLGLFPDYDAFTVVSGGGLGPYVLQWDKPGTHDNTLYITWDVCYHELEVAVDVRCGLGETPDLCRVSVDPESQRNVLQIADSYVPKGPLSIYRQVEGSDEFERLTDKGTTVYLDETHDATTGDATYAVSVTSTCLPEPELSTAHSTIHLMGSLNDSTISLTWTPYAGVAVDRYLVLRKQTSQAARQQVDSTFELMAELSPIHDIYQASWDGITTYEYVIGMVPAVDTLCESLDNRGVFSYSNIATWEEIVTELEAPVTSWMAVYPTRVQETFQLRPSSAEPYEYRIVSPYGQVLQADDERGSVEISCQTLPRGYYYLQVIRDERLETHKIFKE
ncbi:MAG TPA: hypothetical protein DCE41_05045 [Cytophagales bacterium]|nr:hypothetical protein [Cytophagales bacterium]HAA24231.1 hypothetical protein [Cytophagales bacterium]HAP59712.1 hypothetical protein [Cytophagales bacterium]